MKAAIISNYGSPDVFKMQEVAKPAIEKEDDVLIEVKASSINPIDWKTRKGNLKYILRAKFPIILGYDAAGIVVEAGKNVSKFQPGDKVYVRTDRKFGQTLAEYVVASEHCFAKIPDTISFEEAASIPLAALTALQALRDKGNIKKNDEVLINGASGGVGHFAVQFAKNFGAIVTAVCSSNHKELLHKLNPDYHIDYRQIDFTKSENKYDIIFDAVGKESFLTCKYVLKPGGTYITSLPRPKLIFHKFLALYTQSKKVKTLLMESKGDDLEYINKLIAEGGFFTQIDKVYKLEQISEAHAFAQSGKTEGKLVVKIN